MKESIAVVINEPSQTGEARRAALALADSLGFSELERGKVAIVVTELANNLVQHTSGGVILLRSIEHQTTAGIEILALNQGRGMVDVDECLKDGFSTGGTAGNGLGAIYRLSSFLEIYSPPTQGTAILTQLWADSNHHPAETRLDPETRLEVGGVCVPKRGETVSGDAWTCQSEPHRCLLLVVDGLGHGPAAASAAAAALRVFQDHHQRSPRTIIEAAHAALRSTRGAALAIAEIDFEHQSVRFAGVGNIAAKLSSVTQQRNLVSHNGTVGHEVRKVQEFTYPWYENGLLMMHSDGLGSHWKLDRYPGLSQKHPSLIAGVLYRDFHRERDDVTVLVAKGIGV